MKYIICAIIKNEQRYIREWVEYNLNLGFNHIYLYEDYHSNSHNSILLDLIDEDKVTITRVKDLSLHTVEYSGWARFTQIELYRWFLAKAKEENLGDWLAFIDVDEFIVFDADYNLEKLCSEFEEYPGIYLDWVWYGASGHIKRPDGKVVDNYTSHLPIGTCPDTDLWNKKSLVNLHKATLLSTSHHVENGVSTDKVPGREHLCFDKAHINHYYTKSWEDFVNRICVRGNMRNNCRSFDSFFICNPDMKDKENEMISSIRWNNTAADTMWISHKYKIISGGNTSTLNKIREKYRC